MIQSTKPNARITGTLESVARKGVVQMVAYYDTDIEDLWQALTEPRRLARWLVEVEGDLRVGGELRATFTSGWTGTGRVDVCEPPHRLALSMVAEGGGQTVLAAELTAQGAETKLTIQERGIQLGELAAHGAGWQAHVEDLADHLVGLERCDLAARWKEIVPSYRLLASDI